MKYFIVEGVIKNAEGINDGIMKEHIAYAQKAIDEGMILMSALKEDMSGGIVIIRADMRERVERYLADEPMGRQGVQEYRIIEFIPHYLHKLQDGWFADEN